MLLSLKNLQKNYPGFSLDVSMEVEEGQITGLIGANGEIGRASCRERV